MYKVTIKRSAFKELSEIPPPLKARIVDAIDALADNPRRENVKKLKGEESYRIRVAITGLFTQWKT